MRLTHPRIEPLGDDLLDADQEAIVGPMRASGRDYGIFRTFVRHPAAFRAFLGWGGHILSDKNTLVPRDRELLILRTGFLCRAGYEWARHAPIAKRTGLDDEAVAAIKTGSADRYWDERDRALLDAADALVRDQFVPDAVWEVLVRHFDERQRMDIIFTVGQYTMVSMFLNSTGVQLDADVELDSDLDARA